MTNNLLLIFTRNPELGKVKSRLAKSVGEKIALDIYKDLLRHTHDIALDVNADKMLFYSEEIQNNDIWEPNFFQKHIQSEGDLGVKMRNAFKTGFENNYKNIVIIGSDILELSAERINEAFKVLEKKETVIGPAVDGGYYLLGLTNLTENLFQNKEWGTDTVLKSTLNDLEELEQNYTLLSELNDIDYITDIKDVKMIEKYNLESFKKEETC